MDEHLAVNSAAEGAPASDAAIISNSESSSLQAANDERALDVTRELFSQTATLETDCYPRSPNYQLRVISVQEAGSTAAILAKETLWHERMRAALGTAAAYYSLCVYPE